MKEILTKQVNTLSSGASGEFFDMTAPDWLAYITAAKSVLDIFKSIRSELPKGPDADKVQQQIETAEAALKSSDAKLAKNLRYKLCKCRFPPEIMLWHAEERAHICPACGDRFPPPQQRRDHEVDYISVRR
jgi:hypothetical protein